jgi:hypothetical protein
VPPPYLYLIVHNNRQGMVTLLNEHKSFLSPYKICVLILIKHTTERCIDGTVEINELTELLFLLVSSIGIEVKETTEPTFDDLCKQLKFYPHFLENTKLTLQDIVSSIDSFHTFFIKLKSLLQTSFELPNVSIEKSSSFGIFLRKSILSFDKLAFDEFDFLFESLARYYSSPKSTCDASVLQSSCTKEIERFLDAQIHLLTNSTSILPPVELKEKIGKVLSISGISKAHFANSLNAMRCKDYELALVSLHRFFDSSFNSSFNSKYFSTF